MHRYRRPSRASEHVRRSMGAGWPPSKPWRLRENLKQKPWCFSHEKSVCFPVKDGFLPMKDWFFLHVLWNQSMDCQAASASRNLAAGNPGLPTTQLGRPSLANSANSSTFFGGQFSVVPEMAYWNIYIYIIYIYYIYYIYIYYIHNIHLYVRLYRRYFWPTKLGNQQLAPSVIKNNAGTSANSWRFRCQSHRFLACLRIIRQPLTVVFLRHKGSIGSPNGGRLELCRAPKRMGTLPSGKRLHNYGKIHHFEWENQLFLWLCSIALLNYNYCPIIYSLYPHEYSNGITCMFTRGYLSTLGPAMDNTWRWFDGSSCETEKSSSNPLLTFKDVELSQVPSYLQYMCMYIYISYTYRGKQCKFKNHPPHTARVDRFHQPYWSHTCSALQLPGIQKKSHWDKPQNKTKIQTKSSHRSWV